MVTNSKEKKFFIAVLVFYWLSLIVATHIPVPMWVRGMGVSDKTMHFAAYMVLTILVWLASSFDIKVKWNKLRPWLVLIFILFYGIADELSQHFIAGRSTDILDLTSDMIGAAAALIVLTFITGYHATMLLIAMGPIFLPAIVKTKIIKQDSLIEFVVYILAFAAISVAWIIYLDLILKIKHDKKFKCFLLYIVLPLVSLGSVILYALLTHKPIDKYPISYSFYIILMLVIGRIVSIPGHKIDKAH
jgi:hypothetical protein